MQTFRRNQLSYRPADDLCWFVAEQSLRAIIPRINGSIQVLSKDCITRVLNNSSETCALLLRATLLSDIAEDQHHAENWTIIMTDRRGAVVYRCFMTVFRHQHCVIGEPRDGTKA